MQLRASIRSFIAMHSHKCGICGTEYSSGSCWYCHPQHKPAPPSAGDV